MSGVASILRNAALPIGVEESGLMRGMRTLASARKLTHQM